MTAPAPDWRRDGTTPYVHWSLRGRDLPAPPAPGPLPPLLAALVARNFAVPLDGVLLPGGVNPGFADAASWLPDDPAVMPSPPPPGTPLTGVIDIGLPLWHRELRRAGGGTRILAAWQQGAPWSDARRTGQRWLPFGRELWTAQIDALLAAHAAGPDPFAVDVTGFARAAGLIDMRTVAADRELARRIAHGAAVLGTCAGHPPKSDEATRSPLILVNLPPRQAIGTAGGFLDLFALMGLFRIVAIADALWERLPAAEREGAAVQGYPILVNFSFGKQAGGRLAAGEFADALAALAKERKDAGRSRVHVVLPAGNDNLLAGEARLPLVPGAERAIDWVIPPSDATCNFLELWTGPLPGDGRGVPMALSIALDPPGGDGGAPAALSHSKMAELAPGVRAYCEAVPDPAGHRVRYVLCTEPTLPGEAGAAAVRAGRWRLRLASSAETEAGLAVQTDEPSRRGSPSARRSWLDDGRYLRHHAETGRALDAFGYRTATAAPLPGADIPSDGPEGVSRRGTVNAYAETPGAVVVGAHRGSDGQPAPYGGTRGTGHADEGAAFSVDVDAAPTLPGLMVPGAADGARQPLSGTSLAAALATRMAAEILRGHPEFGMDLAAALARRAAESESDPRQAHFGPARPEKIGAGRLRTPRTGPARI